MVRGHQLNTIPDQNYPFDFDISEPPGTELVKCFAADRDVANALRQN